MDCAAAVLCGDCLLAVALDFLHSGFDLGFGRNAYHTYSGKVNIYLHSIASVYLFLAVDFDSLDQRVYHLRCQLLYLGEFAQRPQQLTQVNFLLLGTFQLRFPVLHRCSQILLLFFVAGSHLDETLIRDFAVDIGLEQFFDSLVDLTNTLLTFVDGLPECFQVHLMLRVILLSEEMQEHRLIAAYIIRQAADCFQNDFLQHHVTDIVNFARSASGIVVGTAIKFLIWFQTFCRAEMKFCAAVWAVEQTCKQALPAGFGVPTLVAAELLHTLKFFF